MADLDASEERRADGGYTTGKKGDRSHESSWVLNHGVPEEAALFVRFHGSSPTGGVHFLCGSVHSGHSFQIFAECFHGQMDS